MRHYGTIIRWNDNRKFGAIREENMGRDLCKIPQNPLNSHQDI